jgi:hypothetical protein
MFLAIAFFLVPSCGSHGKSDIRKPWLTTFSPSKGRVYTVALVPPESPNLRGDLEIGLGHEGWNLSSRRRFGIAFDADSDKLTVVQLADITRPRTTSTLFGVADFRIDDLEMSDAGRYALVRQGNFEVFKILDLVVFDAPVPSADLVPSGSVRELLFAPDDRFGLFLMSSPEERVEVIDFAVLDDPLVPYDLDVEGTLVDVDFPPGILNAFVGVEEGTGRLLTLRFEDRTSTESLVEGSLDLGDPSLERVALFHETPRAVAGGTSGRFFLVDFEVLETPIVVGPIDLQTTIGGFRLVVSPDDRFLAIGEIDTGKVFLYQIEIPEVPLLLGVFLLPAPLQDVRFSSDATASEFRRAPGLLVVAADSLSIVDLTDPFRPLLGPSVGFSLSTYFTWSLRNRLFLTGLESSGKVVTYETTRGGPAVIAASVDLGLGGGLSRSRPIFVKR